MNQETRKMSKQELLDQIRTERGHLEETLARLTHAQMLLPGTSGEWSVKDTLAHISAWERRMIEWIGSHLDGKIPAIPLPWDVDRMNAETHSRIRNLHLSEVLEEFRLSYWDSLTLTERLSEEQLQSVFTDTWPMGPLWTGIAANTIWHYKEHRSDIQKWLETQKKKR